MPIHPSDRSHGRLMLAITATALLLTPAGCGQEDPAQTQEPESFSSARAAPTESPEVAALRQTIASNPDDVRAHLALGRLLSEAEQHQEAIQHFERAVQLSPTRGNLFNLAIASAAAMHLNEAQATLKQILASSPDHEQTLHKLGNLELQMGHKEAAIDYLWQAIQARPNNVMASYDLANIYKFYGEYEEAVNLYQSIIRIEPRSAEEQSARADSLYQIAAIEVARGKNEQAEQLLAQLLRRVPDHPRAHYTRGQALMQLGRDDEAQLEFERHIQLLQQLPVTSGME